MELAASQKFKDYVIAKQQNVLIWFNTSAFKTFTAFTALSSIVYGIWFTITSNFKDEGLGNLLINIGLFVLFATLWVFTKFFPRFHPFSPSVAIVCSFVIVTEANEMFPVNSNENIRYPYLFCIIFATCCAWNKYYLLEIAVFCLSLIYFFIRFCQPYNSGI